MTCASKYSSFSFESFQKFSLSVFEVCDWGFRQLSTSDRQQVAGSISRVRTKGISVLCLRRRVLQWSHHPRRKLLKASFPFNPYENFFYLLYNILTTLPSATAKTKLEKLITKESHRWSTNILPHLGPWFSCAPIGVKDMFHLGEIQLCSNLRCTFLFTLRR